MNERNSTTDERREANLRNGREVDSKLEKLLARYRAEMRKEMQRDAEIFALEDGARLQMAHADIATLFGEAFPDVEPHLALTGKETDRTGKLSGLTWTLDGASLNLPTILLEWIGGCIGVEFLGWNTVIHQRTPEQRQERMVELLFQARGAYPLQQAGCYEHLHRGPRVIVRPKLCRLAGACQGC